MAHYRKAPMGKVSRWFGADLEAAGLWIFLLTDPRCGPCGCFQVSLAEMWGEYGITQKKCLGILGRMTGHVTYRDRWVSLRRFPEHQGNGAKWETGVQNDIKDKEPPEDLLRFAAGYPIDTVSIPYAYPIPQEQEQEQEQHQKQEQEQAPPSPRATSKAVETVGKAWAEAWEVDGYRVTSQDTWAVNNAVAEGFTVEELVESVQGWVKDDWPKRKQYSAISRLLEDADKVRQGIELARTEEDDYGF
tara:strand:+ start:233 stop:970 length:738 start_codon:yes stop_codon:yes gene_type:complete